MFQIGSGDWAVHGNPLTPLLTEEAADREALTAWSPPLFRHKGVAAPPPAQDSDQQNVSSHDIVGTGPPLPNVIAEFPKKINISIPRKLSPTAKHHMKQVVCQTSAAI